MDDDTLRDAALADLRDHDARVRGMIDQHKFGAGYIATSNNGKPAGRNEEDLKRLEDMARSSGAAIQDMDNG
ncbi:MAG: hypothetical protein H6923_07325 [Alphaproteobacteria bacterium]|nr:hypothetical protein [Alphaproteobacteria bacterium]